MHFMLVFNCCWLISLMGVKHQVTYLLISLIGGFCWVQRLTFCIFGVCTGMHMDRLMSCRRELHKERKRKP